MEDKNFYHERVMKTVHERTMREAGAREEIVYKSIETPTPRDDVRILEVGIRISAFKFHLPSHHNRLGPSATTTTRRMKSLYTKACNVDSPIPLCLVLVSSYASQIFCAVTSNIACEVSSMIMSQSVLTFLSS